MRSKSVLLGVVALAIAGPSLVKAQGAPRSRDSNKGAPEQAALPTVTMPTVKALKERANVAALLIDKRKKLGLNDAAVASLKTIAESIDARNEPKLSTYDSLRLKVRAAQNSGEGETLEGRARVAMAGTAMGSLREGHEADVTAVLAVIPADKHEEAKKIIADQQEDFQKLVGPRRGGGSRRP